MLIQQTLRRLAVIAGTACVLIGIGVLGEWPVVVSPVAKHPQRMPSGARVRTGATVSIRPTGSPSPIIRTTIVGKGPLAMVADTQLGHVFVANYLDGTVSILDASTGIVRRRTRRVASRPSIIAVDQRTGRVFVTSQRYNGSVSALDVATGALLHTAPLGVAIQQIAVNERTGRVFVSGFGTGKISMLDAASGALVRTLPVGDNGPGPMAVDERDGEVFVVTGRGVEIRDGRTGSVRNTTRAIPAPAYLAVTPWKGKVVVVGGPHSSDVYLLDAHTGTVGHPVRVGPDVTGLAVDKRTGHAFLTDAASFDVVDVRAGILLRTLRIGAYPSISPVIDTQAGRVFVVSGPTTHAAQLAGKTKIGISVLDATTGVLRRTINVYPPPYPLELGPPLIALAVDEHTRRAFFTNGLNNTVTVLDTSRL